MKLSELWAKPNPFQSVITHGVTAGIVAQVIYQKVLSPGNRALLQKMLHMDDEELEAFLGYLMSLHDIGKITCAFQCGEPKMESRIRAEGLYDTGNMIGHVRHEKDSKRIMNRIWIDQTENEETVELLAGIIGAHHQGKIGKSSRYNQQWMKLQDEFEREMRAFFLDDRTLLPGIDEKSEGTAASLLLGIMILADWIASGEAFRDAEQVLAGENGKAAIQNKARQFFEDNGFCPSPVSWPDSFCGVWTKISEQGKRPVQAEVERIFLGQKKRTRLVLIEAPMGDGKTEAGIYAALQMQKQWKKNGIYVAMPTSATSNQMVGRVRELLKTHSLQDTVRLLHAMAWLVDDHTPEKEFNLADDAKDAGRWLAPLRRGLLSPNAVGTVDQAMLAATQVKFGALRLLGLANKVLLIDEIHSYDMYMSKIIIRLLQWCGALEIPVVMLSATLPEEKKRELLKAYGSIPAEKHYPAVTIVTEDNQAAVVPFAPAKRSLAIQTELVPILKSPKRIAAQAISAVQNGGCLCVLMNTVKEAQEVYLEIEKQWSGETLLFHAQYPAERRDEIEADCILRFKKNSPCRPKQAILVATQVVEQSLDVDFDGMITAIAPIDLLLQRIGRVFRFDNTPRPPHWDAPKVWVLTPETENQWGASAAVYHEWLLERCVALLAEKKTICLPDDLNRLVQDGYDSRNIPADEIRKWMDMTVQCAMDGAKSSVILLSEPSKEYSPLYEDQVFADAEDQSFAIKTRLGEPTVRIALLEGDLLTKVKTAVSGDNKPLTAPVKDKNLAREVLKRSVSIREKRIASEMSKNLHIKGDKLLAGVIMFPAENGKYRNGGFEIHFDPNLGVRITGGET